MEYWAKTFAKNGGVASVTIQEGVDRLRELETEAKRLRAQVALDEKAKALMLKVFHNEKDRAERAEAELSTERGQLRAEVELDEALQLATESSLKTAIARAEKAENELKILKETFDHVTTIAIVSLLREAQEAMENLPMGGIGRDGATQAEIDAAEESGHALEDDASYHQGQKTWLILERAKAECLEHEASLLGKISQLERQLENYIYRYESML